MLRERKYRVLHLITRLELGGAQQNTLYCTRHHDRRRFDVQLVAGRGGVLDDEAMAIPDATVQLVPYLRHPIDPLADMQAVFRLRSYIRQERIDLVHTHSSKAGLVGRIASSLAGVPVVHTVHGWSFNESQPDWKRRAFIGLERIAATVSERLIVVADSGRVQGLARRIGRRPQYELLHSGIDVRHYREAVDRDEVRRELGVGPGEKLVGTVACLKPQKAPLDFIRAAAVAHARDPRLRFVIAGDGPLREAAGALVRDLGLEGAVQLLGWRRDVNRLLQAMDVFLLTSLFEGLPRSVLQAMAAGVPVVATAVDGTPEVIQHRMSGLLVPPGQPEQAALAVLELVGDPAAAGRYVAQASRTLDGSFDIARMVRQLEHIYLSVLEAA